jgi:putative SOS response-associated peptidase YedK
MCGRFALSAPVDTLCRHFGIVRLVPLQPRYNIAPGQQIAVLRSAGGRELMTLRWGLIPPWEGEAGRAKLVNARAETVDEKPSFRLSFRKYRCLIPANGFYEWRRVPEKQDRQPYFVRMRHGGLFAMAGLWSRWQNRETGEVIESAAIITTEPNTLLSAIHDRMPVILSPKQYDAWLDHKSDAEGLKSLLGPYPAEEMTAYPVSGLCNSAKYDIPECIQEVR